jgi:hypothetical protein
LEKESVMEMQRDATICSRRQFGRCRVNEVNYTQTERIKTR